MKIKKTHAVLLLFVLLGAGLRIIAAHNLDVNPDEMIYSAQLGIDGIITDEPKILIDLIKKQKILV